MYLLWLCLPGGTEILSQFSALLGIGIPNLSIEGLIAELGTGEESEACLDSLRRCLTKNDHSLRNQFDVPLLLNFLHSGRMLMPLEAL